MNRKAYILFFILLMVIGLFNAFYFPIDKNELENRPAVKFNDIEKFDFMKGIMQENFENTLKDQIPFSQESTRFYNYVKSVLGGKILAEGKDIINNMYVDYHGLYLFGGDYIVYPTRNFNKMVSLLDKKINNTNELIKRNPKLDFYIYYIEKDTDINFQREEKVGIYEYLKSNLNVSSKNIGRFEINSFTEYAQFFYKTDHHWNNIGAHKGYTEISKLMNLNSPKEVRSTFTFPSALVGSKARQTGTIDYLTEDFTVNVYDEENYDLIINGAFKKHYGNGEFLRNNPPDKLTYGDYYGEDNGGMYFYNEKGTKDSVLIIGESYDNAIMNLLASHFRRTYSVDLRYYESELGKPFNFDKYVKDNSIDTVLFIGNIDFFTMEDFIIN